MDVMWILAGLLLVVWILASPIVFWRMARRLARMQGRLDRLERLARGTQEADGKALSTATRPAGEERPGEPPDRALAAPGRTLLSLDATLERMSRKRGQRAAGQERSLESWLAERWFVWVGAIALAMGGLFAAGWAIEEGLLSARARLVAASLFALFLVLIGESLRRRERGAAPTLVPAALCAGGLATLYGTVLAAHIGHALIGPTVSLVLLVTVSLASLVLGLVHGAMVLLIGTLGAYSAPILIDAPLADLSVFYYLAAVAVIVSAAAGLRSSRWLAWLNTIAASLWAIAGQIMADGSALADLLPLAFHLTALAGSALVVLSLEPGRLKRPANLAAASALLLASSLAVMSGHASPLIALQAALIAATLLVAWQAPRALPAAFMAGLSGLASALLIDTRSLAAPVSHLRDPAAGLDPVLWVEPVLVPVAAGLGVVALVFALAGVAAVFTRRAAMGWASIAVAIPLLALAGFHARANGLEVEPGFAALAALLAIAFTLLAVQAHRARLETAASGIFAVGAVAAIALGLAMTLEDDWLRVALALTVAATCLVATRLDLTVLVAPAAGLALLLLASLLVGEVSTTGIASLAYGLGLPGLALALGAFLLRMPEGSRRLGAAIALIDLSALAHILAMGLAIARELARTIEGDAATVAFADTAGRITVLLALALALLVLHRADKTRIAPEFGWIAAFAIAAAAFASGPLTTDLPLANAIDPGPLPVFNLLLFAYLAPALILFAIARRSNRMSWIAGALGYLAGLAWITLEVLHELDPGPGLVLDPANNNQMAAITVAWLVYAAMMLVAGLRAGSTSLRAAALLTAVIAIVKVFFWDLAELSGLYRAATFIGLGVALVGIGWLYGRTRREPPSAAAAAPG